MTKKEKDVLLLSLLLLQLRDKYSLRPTDIIQGYKQEKVIELYERIFDKLSTKESLIKEATNLYYDLKIK
jgi:hypothetical protein